MLLLRFYRKKACELKTISRHFLTVPKSHHSSKKCEIYLSRFHHNLLGVQVRCCSTDNYNTSKILEDSDVENFPDTSDLFDREDAAVPQATNTNNTCYSDVTIEQYRKNNNIIVRGDNVPDPIMNFNELPLPEPLKEILNQENYSNPTPIQSQGWPVAFSGRDMVGVSQTGSGKTLAYMLPAVVHASNEDAKYVRRVRMHDIPSPKVLVLGPTRELVQQILQVSKSYIQASNLKGACVYGGASRIPQLNHLHGSEICVATPGRLLDYLENRETSLKNCTYLVLDEADRMLDMGFEPQIREIINNIPAERQTLMWSATWPKEIRNLAEAFLRDYIHITVGDADLVANPNIQQNIYVVREQEKFDKFFSLLSDILEKEPSKILVFAETKRKVDQLTRFLVDKGYVALGIHGDCTQNQRDRILRDFRMRGPSILVATDIASRGLDITDIQHVFNFDFPSNVEDYIHRIGRTARGSACGKSHSLFTAENANVLKDLLSVLKKSNQDINPELYNLVENAPSRFYKPQKRYNYNASSYAKNRNSYGDDRYDNKRTYGKNRFGDERSRMKYGRERMNIF